ncbi:DUF6161 domain-containing protein [Noviherbaspirillum malthae]|uniref:DUF6161 domain-containing protein n=1 Tax=Noviherbaspirillum malthae TaxID=1260987 RepID=UPI00188EEAA1|nr:DUF6161 domain-containing protein [Noviherbaspirillum malthae]
MDLATDSQPNILEPAPEPTLFSLDFGSNGGVLAPTSTRELQVWIQSEIEFWAWVASVPTGSHRGSIDEGVQCLHNALQHVQNAIRYEGNSSAISEQLGHAQNYLRNGYIKKELPHSSSALAERVNKVRERDPLEAIAYLFVFLPKSGNIFDSRDLSSWRGFLTGISELYGFPAVPHEAYETAVSSAEKLRARVEQLLGEKTEVFNGLHRHYQTISSEITTAEQKHKDNFLEFIKANQATYDKALQDHKDAMSNLEQTFREKMTLRAPVEYWEGRQSHHTRRSTLLGWSVFGSMSALAVAIGLIANWVLSNLKADGTPEAWRVSVLALIGVLGVWAVRLIVRMFLSNVHLGTDAAERVTMVKTYLALLEGDKLPSDDDRKLILQALFRPASDGLVKDEGLPHPALEALTRIGR